MNTFPIIAIVGVALGISISYILHDPLDPATDELKEWTENFEKYSENAVFD